MTKVLPATCEAGVVKAEGVAIPSATVLSEGVAKSEGLLVMEEDKQTYLTSSASDLKETLENLIDALTKLNDSLKDIATGPVGSVIVSAVGPDPKIVTTEPALAGSLNLAAGEVQTSITALTNLKGSLK